MSKYGSLFERLADVPAARKQFDDEAAITLSVANHLAKMLSTRAGSVQTLPDYGLPDLNDLNLSLHDSLQQSRIAIERFVELYEPRLSEVRVVTLPRTHDPLNLSFSIEGMIEVDGIKREVSFGASLNGSGQVKINKRY
ncbi:type VI secretion system baseplate subunit TssE [Gammaproteobacteria bacterium ESL0073]|nr:type VI secretion system baseplate subunit TssE [Gammaproteobacteria bacterium ESL0073]